VLLEHTRANYYMQCVLASMQQVKIYKLNINKYIYIDTLIYIDIKNICSITFCAGMHAAAGKG
jgi:hypothetical protein